MYHHSRISFSLFLLLAFFFIYHNNMPLQPNPSLIQNSLLSKYQEKFYFFTGKFISELIYEVGSAMSIQYEDVEMLCEEIEFMRREYCMIGQDGKEEINDRVKMVAKYYEENYMLTTELPLMFLTDTRDVLQKRVKRLRKLKQNVQSPSSGSKDGSSGFQSCSGKFTLREDKEYLNELSLSYSELMWDESSFFMDWNREIDQDVHDIYEKNSKDDDISENDNESQLLMVNEFLDGEGNQITFHRQNKQKVMKVESKVQEQNEMNIDFFCNRDVDHLICDFQDVDVQQAVEFYRQIMKTKHGSVVMSEILEQQYKNSSNISLHRLSSHITQNPEPQHPVITLSFPHQPLKLSKRLQTQPVLSNYLSIFGPHKKHQNNLLTINQHRSRTSSQSIKKKHMHELIYFNEGLSKAIMQNEEQEFDQSQMFKKKQNRTAKIREKAQKLLEKIRADSLAGQITVK